MVTGGRVADGVSEGPLLTMEKVDTCDNEMRAGTRYLIERRTDSVDPLHLKPWQLILPVSIKDGLGGESC